ncbi:hypothetical protein BH23VER1_BH23VER1_03980 [soil metagenome]
MAEFDCLIVGQGLAGSVLAVQLVARGWKVLAIDREEEVTSSKVAAGLVTPITGKNLAMGDSVPERLGVATRFYTAAERVLGSQFWYEKKILRLFRDESEGVVWADRLAERPDYRQFVSQPKITPGTAGKGIHDDHGGFEMDGGGYLDVPVFLRSVTRMLKTNGGYRAGEVGAADIDAGADGVVWNDVRAKFAVFCQGYQGNQNPFFEWVPFKSAKGEILDLEIPGFHQKRILNSGGWLLPVGGGLFRAGSTYSWDPLDTEPTRGGERRIGRNVRRLVEPRYRVIGHRAAVRPIIHASRVLMGRHPAHERVVFFNGLGSKGVLNAPFYADMLAAHLMESTPLEEEVDLRKNF